MNENKDFNKNINVFLAGLHASDNPVTEKIADVVETYATVENHNQQCVADKTHLPVHVVGDILRKCNFSRGCWHSVSPISFRDEVDSPFSNEYESQPPISEHYCELLTDHFSYLNRYC